MGYQPKAPPMPDPADPMRRLLAHLKRIDRSGRSVTRREWMRLARRWVTCKRAIERGDIGPVPPTTYRHHRPQAR